MALANLRLRESLRVQSVRDPLTGLFNRRHLTDALEREVKRCDRRERPLSVVMIDVDHFKRFNDLHGHAAGDAVLKAVAQALQATTRSEDILCRYGGEEFTLVMPEAGHADALRRAEQIRQAVSQVEVVHDGARLPPLTASLGVASYPEAGRDPCVLLSQADAALYRAKAAGRNQVASRERH
ncbi:MAG: GGDEF domain-containing protein [Pseudomonadota bacterium]